MSIFIVTTNFVVVLGAFKADDRCYNLGNVLVNDERGYCKVLSENSFMACTLG